MSIKGKNRTNPLLERFLRIAGISIYSIVLAALSLSGCTRKEAAPPAASAPHTLADGKQIFRFDTFGDETFWTDTLHINEVVQRSVDPTTALSVGLKVDADALPAGILEKVDLKSPATTVALLKMNAVVGVVATVDSSDHITRLGITCALCHSTVDNSVTKGIGHRLDGWPNRDLNVGAIIALSPAVTAAQKAVYSSWGPGKYDPRYNVDGKNTPLVLPPAFGLSGVKSETYTAEGPISYWNAYVAVTQMHGRGNFSDPKLGIHIVNTPDQVTSKLPALREYQFSLETPKPQAGSFDAAAAERGMAVFTGAGKCATCHAGSIFTDSNDGTLHAPSETGMDPRYAERTTNKRYRTTPLRALWQHPPYFHDGSAATLSAVVSHYDHVKNLGLTDPQKRDLAEYLKTL